METEHPLAALAVPLLLRPLAARQVRLLWGALTLSAMGDQLYAVALVWVAVSVFGPAAGYLSAFQAGCGLAASLLVGRWADRWDQRRAMAGADGLRAAVLALLVVWWLSAGGPPSAALVLAILALAAGEAIFRPALTTTLPGLVPQPQLLPAMNALLDATERTARLVGPGLVGLLAGVVPVVHFFTLDAISFLVSGLAVLSLGRLPRQAAPLHRSLLSSTGRGFAVVRRHRLLWAVLLCSGPINGLWFAAVYLALPLVIEQFRITGPGGTGLGAFGLVVSAYGCTNFAATLVVGSRAVPPHPGRMMFVGTLIVGGGIVCLAPAAGLGLGALMAAAALAAIGGPMKDIPTAVLRQTQLPAGDVASAMRAFMVANYSAILLAMLVAPTIAERIGPRPFITLCGAGLGALACWGLCRHWADGRDYPPPGQQTSTVSPSSAP